MNGDLISRQAAIDAMTECYWSIMGDEPPKLDEKTALYVDLKQAVKRLSSAEKKGKWIDYCGDLKCDQCGCEADLFGIRGEWNYCPNCGARMTEESE